TALAVYGLAVTFPHEEVQTMVGKLAQVMGRSGLYQAAAISALTGATLTTWVLMRKIAQQSHRTTLGLFWFATLLLIALTWRYLSVNNTQLVHYPQYLFPGIVLFALTSSATESLAWVTLLGGLDECFQYWGLHGGWGIPYDFNDIYMDLLGGAV